MNELYEKLKIKSVEVRCETLLIHKASPETRVASSLSCVEIFVALYYGGILNFNAKVPFAEDRDRFVISKGHGSISMYPILADLGFFDKSELNRVCHEGSFLGGIPDPIIPGYETVNGSLGHGFGVSSGMAIALKRKGSNASVFTLLGDGEINEGSNWEAMMFASHHSLDNLTAILDNNKVSMLDFSRNILDLDPLIRKVESFGFNLEIVDGHKVEDVYEALKKFKSLRNGKPNFLIANTLKGKGAPQLETNPLSHILSLKPQEIDEILTGFNYVK